MKSLLSILILSATLTLNVSGERETDKHQRPSIQEVRKVKKAFQEDKELRELIVKVEKRLEILGINKKFTDIVTRSNRSRIRPQSRNFNRKPVKHKERSKNDRKGDKKKFKNRRETRFEHRLEGKHGVVVVN